MRRVVLLGSLLLLMGVAGCRSDSYPAIMKEVLTASWELRVEYSKAKSKNTADSIEADVAKIHDRLKALKERLDNLPQMNEFVKERLERKYGTPLIAAYSRLEKDEGRLAGFNEKVVAPVKYIDENFIPQELKAKLMPKK
jgi:hypothetical protein